MIATAQLTEYDAQDVQRMLEQGTARLIDVREAEEHRREHISGSTLLPCSAFSSKDIVEQPGVKTILYCRSGRRSKEAARRLLDAGHAAAAHLRGGIEEWKAQGLPVEAQTRWRMPVMQQTQFVIGTLILVSTILGIVWTPWALGLTLFMGFGLIMAGLTGRCPMASMIAMAPWNESCCDSGVCKN